MSTEHAMRETVEALQARFEKDAMAYHDRYLRFTDWHWKKKAEDAKKWRDVFSQLNEQCKAALAAPESDQESPEGQIDSNEKAMRSVAAEMHEACRAMNDDGDPTLCEKLKCPHYGEPNGCNSPTGEYRSVGNSAAMCQALRDIAAICDGGDTGGLPERILIYNLAKAALSKPPRQCDVGTVEEQKDRFMEFCDDEKGDRQHCRNCRLCNACDCELAWAQMPYTAEREGDSDDK